MRFILLMFLLMGCGSLPPEPEAPGAIGSPGQIEMLFAVGDSVEVVAGGADIYDSPGGAIVDFAPEGSRGVVLKTRTRDGIDWSRVDFTESFAGDIVQDSRLVLLGDTTGPPPPPPPPGGKALVFGCSNFSNIADAINSFSAEFSSNGGSPGNRGKTIINYGEASSGAARVFDHVRADLDEDIGFVIAGLCHRVDYQGENRPGARVADVPYLLPVDSSGSSLYGEMELVRRMAINTREAIDDAGFGNLPLYMLALHDYDPDNSCLRVGNYVPTILRQAIANAVSEGLVSEMTLNGEAFKLLELVQPSETTSEGCHISAPGQEKLVKGNPGGGLDDWYVQR